MPLLWHVNRGGISTVPLTYLLRDEFTTADAAPLDASRDCEPGPGTMEKVSDTNGNAYILGGKYVCEQVSGEDAPEYYFGPRANDATGVSIAGTYNRSGNDFFAVGKGDAVGIRVPYLYFNLGSARIYATNASNLSLVSVSDLVDHNWAIHKRSVGYFFILDGELLWVDPANGTTTTRSIYTKSLFTGANWSGYNSDITKIDLPAQTRPDADGSTALWAKWGDDFSLVSDSASAPAAWDTFNCDADCHISYSFTYEAGKLVYCRFRQKDTDDYIVVESLINNLYLKKFVENSPTVLGVAASIHSDGVACQIDIVANGSSLKVFFDGVLKFNVTDSTHSTETNGTIYHTLATNDIELESHPYPSLGIATDRVIAPQANGTLTHTDDFVAVFRNVPIPSVGNQMYDTRKINATNYLRTFIGTGGELTVWEIINGGVTGRISGGAGTVSADDDLTIICDGASCSVFVNGTQVGSTATLSDITSGTSGGFFNQVTYGDSAELWPRDVSSLLPKELGGSV